MNPYIPVVILMVLAGIIGVTMIFVGGIIRPSKPDRVKSSVYECGMPAFSDARKRYNVRFYIIAMLFVIFDVETVFLFPWAVSFDVIGIFGLIEMILFLIILIFGYFYAWRKGALEWA